MNIAHFWKRLRARRANKSKNRRLNRNINRFQRDYASRETIPREVSLRPEVLIPCFNHGRFLACALASVPIGIPVTVINDASTDDTRQIAEHLQERYAFKLVSNEKNLNQSGSLNRAIAESDNNLFIVLNADDCLLKYCVPTVIGLFERHPSIRMAGGTCIPFSEAQLLSFNDRMPETLGYGPAPRVFRPDGARHYQKMDDINLTMSSCTFLKSAWQAVDGFWEFPKRVCSMDDRDFQMRVSALFDVAVIDEPLALYRKASSLGRAEYVED